MTPVLEALYNKFVTLVLVGPMYDFDIICTQHVGIKISVLGWSPHNLCSSIISL